MTVVTLKKGKERKVLNGYPWIFSDEIFSVAGDKKNGEICTVFSDSMKFLGKGFFSSSNIAVRMLVLNDDEIDYNFFYSRVLKAFELRKAIIENLDACRIFHGEADGVPGLIADKYNDYIVIQLRNVGVENKKAHIVEAFAKVYAPVGIYERSDFETGSAENIKRNKGVIFGKEPEPTIIVQEHGLKYNVDIINGQKTGFFFDQKDSRFFVRQFVDSGSICLDAYTFTGGFAMNMAVSGAKKVYAVDKDEQSLEMAKRNVAMNNIENIEFFSGTYEKFMQEYSGDDFDVVILDPPSLIKKKEERRKGLDIFKGIVKLIVPKIKANGIVCLCSCAYQADTDMLIEASRMAFEGTGRSIQMVGFTFQSKDHPYIIQIPESFYLKCVWLKIK
ncbi:MAG TPA: class I SAM-dependent rRNA methyltransferase [Petrotogaceae bacterium]|nr:class I SAM-dependent rRNA methyltransferase [Petrotogaceae bacterium]HQO12161.1 class I SAM-dependent rRNA methyltransferase [Petrotogaceae bacterium]HQP58019.1 class I SAM-dependent rRNA methyltransferase [Petrotogaceae bacterium]